MSHRRKRYTDDVPPDTERCPVTVYIRDTYRYTGRSKSGFEMHYNRDRCRRKMGPTGYCWQHAWKAELERPTPSEVEATVEERTLRPIYLSA